MTMAMMTRLSCILASIIASTSILGIPIAMAEGESMKSSPVLLDGSSATVVETTSAAKKVSAKNLTMYHINPMDYPVDPVNMNLADLNGAVYFDLFEMLNIFWCSDKNPKVHHPKFFCDNPEYDGKGRHKDIGVTKLIVQVTPIDNKLYGEYAMCNLCRNGGSPIDPFHKCRHGEYVCDCFGTVFLRHKKCANPAVGRKRLYYFGGEQDDDSLLFQEGYDYYDDVVVPGYSTLLATRTDDRPPPDDTEYNKTVYSQLRAVRRLHGFWYSTLDIGQGRTWRTVRVAKRVTKECHASSFVRSVQEHDRTRNDDRFAECLRDNDCGSGDHHHHNNNNRTQPNKCWVECFADALLGPNSTQAEGYHGGGMNQRELLEAWSRPFDSDDPDKGGCPDMRPE